MGSHHGSDTGAKRPNFETRCCKLCDKYGGKSDTHNTYVCKKYKADGGTRMSTLGRQQSNHQTEELFSTIAEMEKKLTKMSAKSKKTRKRRKNMSPIHPMMIRNDSTQVNR
eukprot:scaffold63059_cov67-Attheya_sp.AAC.3